MFGFLCERVLTFTHIFYFCPMNVNLFFVFVLISCWLYSKRFQKYCMPPVYNALFDGFKMTAKNVTWCILSDMIALVRFPSFWFGMTLSDSVKSISPRVPYAVTVLTLQTDILKF